MKTTPLKYLLLAALASIPLGLRASGGAILANLDLKSLETQANERVTVTLDKSMIEFAAEFLPDNDPNTPKVRNLITNLDGIDVRVFGFEDGNTYSKSEVEAIRKQLPAGWSKLVEARGEEDLDLYAMRDGKKFKGFFLIDAEPSSHVVLVNVQGSINPCQLKELEGFAGIPKGIFKDSKEKAKGKDCAP